MYIKKSSREDFALRSKLWPNNFGKHRPIFAGNSRSTGISQLQAGKTRSKRARSHFSAKGVCSLMYNGLITINGPSKYLSSFSSWSPKRKKFHFSRISTCKKIRRPAADSILMPPTCNISILNRYTPKFSGVNQKLTWCQLNSFVSRSSQSEVMPI